MDLGFYLIWTIFIPFVYGIFKYKSIKNYKWLFYFICLGSVNEIVNRILIVSGVHNTLLLSHIYAFVSFMLLSLFYQSVLKNFIGRKWFLILMLGFSMFYAVNLVFLQSIQDYPDLPFSISSLVFITLSLLYFYKIMIEAKIVKLTSEPLFWINTGIIIYFTGNLFFHILFNLMLNSSREFLLRAGFFFRVMIGLFYIIIFIGFLKENKINNKKY